ncbi:MAG: hypothetical protein KGL39_56930 [Patescibacteria group bacterium]|nr:hypothetical protein [Patescibacteria group bacterium]
MGKLQPNFSWQKYESKPEDSREQFQYQMQQEHVVVANSVNATIDDESFFTRERQTSFTWVNNHPIWTKTIATSAWTAGGTINTIPLGISGNFTVIDMVCCISDGTLSSSNTLLMPHIDVAVAANEVSIVRNGTNIILTSGGTNRSAYSGYVTVYFIKN